MTEPSNGATPGRRYVRWYVGKVNDALSNTLGFVLACLATATVVAGAGYGVVAGWGWYGNGLAPFTDRWQIPLAVFGAVIGAVIGFFSSVVALGPFAVLVSIRARLDEENL